MRYEWVIYVLVIESTTEYEIYKTPRVLLFPKTCFNSLTDINILTEL